MSARIIRLAAAIGLFLVPWESYGQQPFRVSTTLVQVDAVVTDSQGHQVTGLTASDFELYADGQPQKITTFSYVALSPASRPLEPAKTAFKDLALALPPAATIAQKDVRRTIVLMIDDLNLSFESLAFVRSSLLKFIDEQVQPGDLIAVCRTGAGSSAQQQFTADRRVARNMISGLRWNPNGLGRISFLEAYDQNSDLTSQDRKARSQDVKQDSPNPRGTDAPAITSLSLPGEQPASQLDHLRRNSMTAGALGAIDYVVQALREMPGRKSVILFSDGFELDRADNRVMNAMHRLVDRANRSGTVIYTMHAAGLQVLLPTAADNPNLSNLKDRGEAGERIGTMTAKRSEELFNAQSGLDYLAAVTGGFPYLNGNDLNYGLGRILEDQRGYYLLGYSPPPGTFDEKKGERPYHKLRVVVKDAQLSVRSRSGFFGATDEETKPQYADGLEQLRAKMLSPFNASGIRLRLTPLISEVAGRGLAVRNLLDIDTRDLTFSKLPDGSSRAAIKLMVAAYGMDNKPIKTFAEDYRFTVAAGKMKEAERDGVMYTLNIDLPRPGGIQVRAAVQDEATAKIGSAHEFIEIPDLRKQAVSLTSLILADSRAGSGESMSLGASAARREFQRGDILQYFCLVEGGNRNMSAKLRVVHENRQILLLPLKIEETADHKHAISGQLKIGSAMTPGDYFVQVIASAGGKPAIADQWTDFEIVP